MSYSQVTKLTKTTVDNATPVTTADGKVRQRLLWDTELTGFGVVIGSTTKTFVVQRRVNGMSRRVTIGRYGGDSNRWTVAKAREEAGQLLAQMDRGEDPKALKHQQAAKGVTLDDALNRLEIRNKADNRATRTVEGYRVFITRYLFDWLSRPLESITPTEAIERHQKIHTDIERGKYATVKSRKGKVVKQKRKPGAGKYAANHTFRAFRAAYNEALREHYSLPPNPAKAVKWFKEDRRQSTIPADKLKDWYASVMKMSNGVRRDFFLCLLFTGLRRGSASEMRWEHIDFEGRKLHIPRPKGGAERKFDIPLSDYLIELFAHRKRENDELVENEILPKSDWVFPAASKSGHVEEPKLKFAEGEQRWSPHDLRRVFMTVAESLDVSMISLKLLVNHKTPRDVTAGYVIADVERLRPPMQKITDRLRELCDPKETEDKVVPLRGGNKKRVAK